MTAEYEPNSLTETTFPNGTAFGEQDRTLLIGQYKLFVDTSERLVARRQTVNAFFLSLNTLLLSAIGFGLQRVSSGESELGPVLAVLAVCIAGVIVSLTWKQMVSSFKQLNTGKFAVIHELEEHLPAAIFKAEWLVLGAGRDRRKYVPFTKSERVLAWVFVALYVVAGSAAVALYCTI